MGLENLDINIKKIINDDRDEALNLVLDVFMEFGASDFSEEGVQTFKNYIDNKELSENLEMYGAYYKNILVGVIATRNEGNHITLLFVDGNYHRNGIGRILFKYVLELSSSENITVNSSPYAVEVYHHLGFIETDFEHIDDGIRYTPMVYINK